MEESQSIWNSLDGSLQVEEDQQQHGQKDKQVLAEVLEDETVNKENQPSKAIIIIKDVSVTENNEKKDTTDPPTGPSSPEHKQPNMVVVRPVTADQGRSVQDPSLMTTTKTTNSVLAASVPASPPQPMKQQPDRVQLRSPRPMPPSQKLQSKSQPQLQQQQHQQPHPKIHFHVGYISKNIGQGTDPGILVGRFVVTGPQEPSSRPTCWRIPSRKTIRIEPR